MEDSALFFEVGGESVGEQIGTGLMDDHVGPLAALDLVNGRQAHTARFGPTLL